MSLATSKSPTPLLSALLSCKHDPERSTSLKRSKERCVFEELSLEVLVPRMCKDNRGKEVETMILGSPMENSPIEGGGGSRELKFKRRPTMLVIPDLRMTPLFERKEDPRERDLEVGGDGYCMVSRRGSRMVMEDGYEAITNICGDPKQALFGVFDGHGGRAAVDFVCENLGKNIIRVLQENNEAIEFAIRTGHLTTDLDFLSLNLGSGVCTATVLLKDGELHAANVGDCRVVLSRNGKAQALTSDHRATRNDERQRIEDMGGIVNCHNGVWRVQRSLSISRAIGDLHMKEWIISEPEISSVRLTHDCHFAIIASDGLWDKVTDQEAVDVVLQGSDPMQSCRDMIEIASTRGSRDDITVMVIKLHKFLN